MFAPRVSVRPRGILDETRHFLRSKPGTRSRDQVNLVQYRRKHVVVFAGSGLFVTLHEGFHWAVSALRRRFAPPAVPEQRPGPALSRPPC